MQCRPPLPVPAHENRVAPGRGRRGRECGIALGNTGVGRARRPENTAGAAPGLGCAPLLAVPRMHNGQPRSRGVAPARLHLALETASRNTLFDDLLDRVLLDNVAISISMATTASR